MKYHQKRIIDDSALGDSAFADYYSFSSSSEAVSLNLLQYDDVEFNILYEKEVI
jgi:hypothetical protein